MEKTASIEKLPEDHIDELTEHHYAYVTCKVSDYKLGMFIPYSWTCMQLKEFIIKNYAKIEFDPKTMKILYSGRCIEDEDSMDCLRKNWKLVPITMYINDPNMKVKPDQMLKTDKSSRENLKDRKRRKRVRKAKLREEKLKNKILNNLSLPKSIFVTHLIFLFTIMYLTNGILPFSYFFWILYYYEVRHKIINFYNKKLSENNIPYETDQQIETNEREKAAQDLMQASIDSEKWNEENYCREYTYYEITSALVYYFFASFFPAYIERQLDIFQKQHNLLQSQKRIRDRKRELEAKKQQEKEQAEEIVRILEEHDKKNEQFNLQNNINEQELRIDANQDSIQKNESNKDDSPLIMDES